MTTVKGPPIPVTLDVEHVTERAVLVNINGRQEWLPKSQIHRGPGAEPFEKDREYDAEIPEWLAKKVGYL